MPPARVDEDGRKVESEQQLAELRLRHFGSIEAKSFEQWSELQARYRHRAEAHRFAGHADSANVVSRQGLERIAAAVKPSGARGHDDITAALVRAAPVEVARYFHPSW